MKPLKQRYRHDPENGIYGDCFRTAVATVLGLERDSVPHFADGWPDGWEFHRRIEAFLANYNLRCFSFILTAQDADDVMRHVACMNGEDFVYLLSGVSPRGTDHVVVCRGSQMFSDPALDGGGLVGPCSDGYYWVYVLSPLNILKSVVDIERQNREFYSGNGKDADRLGSHAGSVVQ